MAVGFIFDVDGTILDSMSIWMDAGNLYLNSLGIETDENIGEVLFDMTMVEGANYLKNKYHIDLTIEQICEGINDTVYDFYKNKAQLKSGIKEFIILAHKQNIPMTIATSTDRPMIEAALKRLDLYKYFDDIFTTTEVGKGKNHPDIFIRAMEKMHTSSENTWMFEDASYSLETAKKIGIKTVGIYDQSSANCQEQLKKVSDIYINNWSESSILLNTIMNYK